MQVLAAGNVRSDHVGILSERTSLSAHSTTITMQSLTVKMICNAVILILNAIIQLRFLLVCRNGQGDAALASAGSKPSRH